MKKKITAIALVLISVMMAVLLSSCRNSNSPPQSSSSPGSESVDLHGTATTDSDVYKDTIMIGMDGSCPNMDPHSNTDQPSKILWKVMHTPLVVQDENLKMAPGVAESWEQPDDRTIVFHLRKGMKFHNGEDVKASDVIFTFNRGKDSSHLSTVCNAIESISAEDDYTVTMVLTSPNPDFLAQLYNYNYVILSEKACTEDPDNGFLIGCGAYKLDEFVLNDHVSFTKFEDFYNADAVRSNHLYFRYIPENSARVIALQNGEIDICLNPATIDLSYIKEDSNLVLYSVDQTNISFITFNLKNSKMQDQKLRQAISCGTNRQELIDVALEGQGAVAKSFWIPAVFGYADDFETYEYDQDRAMELLNQSNYNGEELVVTVADSTYSSVAEVFQNQMLDIGINVKINQIDSAAMASFLKAGEHEMFIRGNSYSLPYSAYNMHYPGKGTNYAFYDNGEVNELLDKAAIEFDTAVRADLYRQVQIIAAEELPYVPLFYRVLNWGAVKGFGGLIPNPSGPHEFTYCYVIVN